MNADDGKNGNEELVKRLYEMAERYEGSEPSGLLVRAGDTILAISTENASLKKDIGNLVDRIGDDAIAHQNAMKSVHAELKVLVEALTLIGQTAWDKYDGNPDGGFDLIVRTAKKALASCPITTKLMRE